MIGSRVFPVSPRHLPAAAAALLALWAPAASAQPVATFPLVPGEAVATFASTSNAGGFSVAVLDLRDPAANAPGVDRNWPAPIYHDSRWTPAGFAGNQVFGVALDDASPPNIYLTASSTYGQLASGKVFRIDGTTGDVSLFAELPNCDAFPACPGTSYAGLGNIAFDAAHRQFFVTDFYDGKIYRLKLGAGGVLDPAATTSFDPFAPFNPAHNTGGFAPLGERPWGVGVFGGRVYFGVWAQDDRFGSPGEPNTVWSVALDAAGDFSGPAELEVTLPPLRTGGSNPVADIAFSVEGRMLLAERTMGGDTRPGAHLARVLEYVGGHGAWSLSPHTFTIGVFAGTNAAGGASYVCDPATGTTAWVLATGDALHFTTRPRDIIYGVEIFPATGGSNANSFLVDLDRNTTVSAKTGGGDIEAFSPCAQAPPSADLDLNLATGVAANGTTRLPLGSVDPLWKVALDNGGSTPAVVVTAPAASWRRFRGPSEWIAVNFSGTEQPGRPSERFERCFCLAADATNAKINMRLWADDEARVFLNGTQIGGPGGGFRRSAPLSLLYMGVVGESLFQPGTNCLAVEVTNLRGDRLAFDAVGRLWVDHGTCPNPPAQPGTP
jgi:hypothetical protein